MSWLLKVTRVKRHGVSSTIRLNARGGARIRVTFFNKKEQKRGKQTRNGKIYLKVENKKGFTSI
jgi:hypothetical protein